LLGQRPSALQGTIGDGDLLGLAGTEVGSTQLNHFASTNEQNALAGD
jgi:hypothetical protein